MAIYHQFLHQIALIAPDRVCKHCCDYFMVAWMLFVKNCDMRSLNSKVKEQVQSIERGHIFAEFSNLFKTVNGTLDSAICDCNHQAVGIRISSSNAIHQSHTISRLYLKVRWSLSVILR